MADPARRQREMMRRDRLGHTRSTAEAVGTDLAEHIDWVEGDLATWTPQPSR